MTKNKKAAKLEAFARSESNLTVLRDEGWIPAVVYGPGSENRNLKVKKSDFEKVFSQAGESSLVDLSIDGGEPVKVLIYDVQREAVKDFFSHVDFYQVDMAKKVEATVRLEFIGESRAVKEQGGTLMKTMDEVEIKCLPADLIDSIEVDISSLNEFGDMVKIADLKIPEGIEVLAKPEETVVSVAAHKVEEEVIPAPAAEEAAKEGEAAAGEEKKEGNEGKAEGKKE